MKTAAAYVRVSTEKQDEYSLDSQLKLIREYAKAHDLIVPDEFVFVEDGKSGRKVKGRQAFQDMVALAKDKEHPFDCILVWKFSRFARNQEESIFYKSMLARSGVDVISISETLDDSPFSSLIERIIEWMDEFYSIRLSGEVKRGMAEKLSRSEVVAPPSFGYSMKDKNYVPDDNADTVRKIYSDFLAGKGMATIARELNALGVKTRRGKAVSNRWVKYILENPVYIGKIRWSNDGRIDYVYAGDSDKAILVDGNFPPLIDSDTWETVQAKLQRRKNAALPYTRHEQQIEWMLKGLVRCSNCGSTLVYSALSSPSMQCHKYAHGACKVSHSLAIRKANAAVIEALQHCVDIGVFPLAPQVQQAASHGPDYAKLIAAEQVKLKRVLAAYEAGVDTLEEYAERKKKLQAAIDALRAEQAGAAASVPRSMSVEDMREKTAAVLEIIKCGDVTEAAKNQALRSILSHIVYEKSAARLALYFSFD